MIIITMCILSVVFSLAGVSLIAWRKAMKQIDEIEHENYLNRNF